MARQFPGHGHSLPSRCLHSIEFFSYLIASEAEAIVIGQVKEIARHEGQTRATPNRVFLNVGRPTQIPQRR
jgi:hypothetical protein